MLWHPHSPAMGGKASLPTSSSAFSLFSTVLCHYSCEKHLLIAKQTCLSWPTGLGLVNCLQTLDVLKDICSSTTNEATLGLTGFAKATTAAISGTWVLILDLLCRWFFFFIYWCTHSNVLYPYSVRSLVLSHFLKHSFFLCLPLEYLGIFLFVFFLFHVWFLPLTNSESCVTPVTSLAGSSCCFIVIDLMLEEFSLREKAEV